MTSGQVLRQVEIPNGLPLMMSGLRSAVLQVVATATVAALFGLPCQDPVTMGVEAIVDKLVACFPG